jgi:hypothetical protein
VDKVGDKDNVFVFATVVVQGSATAQGAPRPAVAAGFVDRQRTPRAV